AWTGRTYPEAEALEWFNALPMAQVYGLSDEQLAPIAASLVKEFRAIHVGEQYPDMWQEPTLPDTRLLAVNQADPFNAQLQAPTNQARLLYVDASGSFDLSGPKAFFTNLRPNRLGGHVALEIDGKVYTKDPSGLHVIDSDQYIHNVTDRPKDKGPQNVYAYDMALNAAEKQVFIDQFKRSDPKFSDKEDWCSTTTLRCLTEATKNSQYPINQGNFFGILDNFVTPSDVVDRVKASGRGATQPIKLTIPKQNQTPGSGFWGLKGL
ncbi:MAG: hypothetical protein KC476_11985, partial [Cyanobacteria bacterium HKST-UBA06]|nr:hypothetical protein [Cyanobacteria bacterium HKST-UBA06]